MDAETKSRKARGSRQKGKKAETEVTHILQPIVDDVCLSLGIPLLKIVRNSMQFGNGGCDLVALSTDDKPTHALEWAAIEVKRCEVLHLAVWWDQTRSEAKGREPILLYRQNNAPWRVRMRGALPVKYSDPSPGVVDIDLETFLHWFRLRFFAEMGVEICKCPTHCVCEPGRVSIYCTHHQSNALPLPECYADDHKLRFPRKKIS